MLDISNCRFAFLDLETTGLSPWFGDRVCEVGIVVTEGKRIRETYQTLVNPQRPLSPAAASTNGLNDAELGQAPLFGDIAHEIATRVQDAIVVCHNARFDLQFLDSEMRRLGQEPSFPNVVDTLLIAREHFDLPSYTLTFLAESFHIQNPDAHRALADALTDKNIFFAMMEALRPSQKMLDDFVGIYSSPAAPEEAIQLPTPLQEAINSGRRLYIIYDVKNKRTERWVTPIQLMRLADYIYLRGFCHLRNEERTFRLDRIVEVRVEQ